jgi:hypothetical protein
VYFPEGSVVGSDIALGILSGEDWALLFGLLESLSERASWKWAGELSKDDYTEISRDESKLTSEDDIAGH